MGSEEVLALVGVSSIRSPVAVSVSGGKQTAGTNCGEASECDLGMSPASMISWGHPLSV